MKRFFLVGIPPNLIKELIETISKYSYELTVVDSQNQFEKFAHFFNKNIQFIPCDISDYKELLMVFKKENENKKIDIIYSFRETALIHTAKIAHQFGLVSNSVEAVTNCVDKDKTRKILSEKGIDDVQFRVCHNLLEIQHFFQQVENGIVIKPLNLRGSIGVEKINTIEKIEAAYQEYQKITGSSTVLVEELLQGEEVCIEFIIMEDDIYLVDVEEKHLYQNTTIESGHTIPHIRTDTIFDRCYEWLKDIVRALDIRFGPIVLEMYINDQSIHLVELHTRYGGDHVLPMAEMVYQTNFVEPIIRYLSSLPHGMKKELPIRRIAGIRYFDLPQGKVVSIEGLDNALRVDGLISMELDLRVGDTVPVLKSSLDRKGWILCCAETRIKLEETLDQIFSMITIKIIRDQVIK